MRDVTAKAADWTWELARRIHLGTRKPANWMQLFKFGVIGAVGYVINIIVFAALTQGLDVHHIQAAIAAFVVAVTNNFLWNRHWTFQASEGHAGFQAARFLTVSLIALGANLLVLQLLVTALDAAGDPCAGDRRRGGHAGQLHRQQAVDLRIALRSRRAVPLAVAAIALLSCLGGAPPAAAQSDGEDELTLSYKEAIRIARTDPNVIAEEQERGRLEPVTESKPPDTWQVGFKDGADEVVQVLIDDDTATVKESWTGHQVEWQMARGYEGSFGHKLNAPYVWIPLCLLFLLGLLDWRRLWRVVHLDLLVLLAFSVSQIYFNRGEIGVSVPLVYPVLAYVLARALWIGFRGRGRGLSPTAPVSWLAIAAIFLIAFRVALNFADSGTIDVGYAGVIGADRITHLDPIWGLGVFPGDNPFGDTYGPVNYIAYVPFELGMPWSGEWDALPAAHAAAVMFDLAAVAGVFFLGRRLRAGEAGTALGIVLAFAWLAYPYTDYTLQSNSNDTLLAALVIWSLVFFRAPAARGALLAAATLTKFVPLVLAPLYAVGTRGLSLSLLRSKGEGGERRAWLRTALAFVVGLRARFGAVPGDSGRRFRSRDVLGPDGGQPGRPHLPLQRLRAGGPGAAADDPAIRRRGARRRARVRPPPALAGADLRPGRGNADRGPDHRRPLVLPLHSVVLRPADGGARDRGSGRRVCRGRRGYGTGTITCSIDAARPSSFTSTAAPITQTFSSEVSKRTGIRVRNDSRACSHFTPRTLSRAPVMPTSEMYAVPFGSTLASAVGTWVWVPSTAAARPSRCQPIATFSLVTSAWKSTTKTSASSARRSSSASASGNGERATFSPTAPLRFSTATRRPPASTTTWPLPGFECG